MEQTYTVRGSWPFPTDMLRHEDAKAATTEDQAMIDRLSAEYAPDKEAFQTVTVALMRPMHHKWSHPNFARWRSFGWVVVQDSLPEHLRELKEEVPVANHPNRSRRERIERARRKLAGIRDWLPAEQVGLRPRRGLTADQVVELKSWICEVINDLDLLGS